MSDAVPLQYVPAGILARRGHFRLESGYHGDLWLDLETLCLEPRRVQRLASDLADLLSTYQIDMVCGPLVEGAFVALLVAAQLDLQFIYAQRFSRPDRDGFFPVEYAIPGALRAAAKGRRVAIVNDVISAGSAVRGASTDLRRCGAQVVAIGALLVLGNDMVTFALEENVGLEALARASYGMWAPHACPLCAQGLPLEIPEDR